jgi:hypothetical protein
MDAKPDGVMDDEVDIEDCGNDSSVVWEQLRHKLDKCVDAEGDPAGYE